MRKRQRDIQRSGKSAKEEISVKRVLPGVIQSLGVGGGGIRGVRGV